MNNRKETLHIRLHGEAKNRPDGTVTNMCFFVTLHGGLARHKSLLRQTHSSDRTQKSQHELKANKSPGFVKSITFSLIHRVRHGHEHFEFRRVQKVVPICIGLNEN